MSYRLSRRAFSKATHASWTRQPMFQALLVLLLALWSAASFAAGMGAAEQQLPTFTFLLTAVAFYVAYPPLAFAADARNRNEVHLEFTRDGVYYRRGGQAVTIVWKAVHQAAEAAEFYVLALPGRMFVAVPKYAFGPDQEQRFRLLAATSGVPIR